MKTRLTKLNLIIGTVIGGLTLANPATAAQTLLINFSNNTTNNLTAGEATTLGADVYQNVTTNQTSTTTASISLDGVSGNVRYSDYYQQNQKDRLGQPYGTFVGAKTIGDGLSVDITLDLGTWLANEDYVGYKITVYYAGRSAATQTQMTDGTPEVFFNDGTLTPSETVTVLTTGTGGFWGGTGAEHQFTGEDLTIKMDFLGAGAQAGISAIKIEGVSAIPEPSTTALLGLGGITWILRRKRR